MTVYHAEFSPPNSMILVVGSLNPEIPDSFDGALIACTSSCIAIGCQADMDGPTQFLFGSVEEFTFTEKPDFACRLDVPDGAVALETVNGDRIAEKRISGIAVNILVWVNHSSEPNEITIAIDH